MKPPRRYLRATRHGERIRAGLERGAIPPRVAILGAGLSGICMAIRLRQVGITSFTMYERSGAVGGTWRDNTYPGAGCDVPSHLYSFSFAPKADWSRKFAEQSEILGYIDECVDRFDLERHVRFGAEISRATWDEHAQVWRLLTSEGDEHEADIFVVACGQLSRPFVPDLVGLDDFGGTTFHSAGWRHDHDLSGERVAVIGNGASAIQFVPEIAPRTEHLTIFQRSPNWIVPKSDRAYTATEKWLFEHAPLTERLHRWWIYWKFEARFLAFRRGSRLGSSIERRITAALEELVSEDLPRHALVPDYPIGCKRILQSNDWYPTLLRDDVEVATSPIDHVGPDGIVTADGELHAADTIVFATGFESTAFLAPMDVIGRDGVKLQERWEEGAEAYLGMAVSGFPNLFILYGPNTNLGHNSILFMVECQVGYVLRCIEELVTRGLRRVEVRPGAEKRENQRVQDDMTATVWDANCRSWYKTESGKITNNWPRFTFEYWRRTREPRREDLVWS